MRKFLRTLIPLLIFACGIGILFYPVFSDIWNQQRQNSLINTYIKAAEKLSPEDFSAWKDAADAYNAALDPAFPSAFTGKLPAADDAYWSMLDLDGSGIMGYIEIPKISVRLALYHGTGEAALQHGVGHLAGTSLPVGGAGTHAALSGHRGLPSALLFTDLDKLAAGDRFYLTVLGETLVYEVDRILVVMPDEVSSIHADADGDYVTLITCTPYGVNTHRLLVRGSRTTEAAAVESKPQITATEQVARSFGWKGLVLLGALGVFLLILILFSIRALVRRKKAARAKTIDLQESDYVEKKLEKENTDAHGAPSDGAALRGDADGGDPDGGGAAD